MRFDLAVCIIVSLDGSYYNSLGIIMLFASSLFIALQVLNGLLIRSDRAEAVSIPVGIIPAGSDNSLVWTVLGVRDPISASLLIVKVLRVSIFFSNTPSPSFLWVFMATSYMRRVSAVLFCIRDFFQISLLLNLVLMRINSFVTGWFHSSRYLGCRVGSIWANTFWLNCFILWFC
jgi:hypothetical protein